jgi:hypothetical protein
MTFLRLNIFEALNCIILREKYLKKIVVRFTSLNYHRNPIYSFMFDVAPHETKPPSKIARCAKTNSFKS